MQQSRASFFLFSTILASSERILQQTKAKFFLLPAILMTSSKLSTFIFETDSFGQPVEYLNWFLPHKVSTKSKSIFLCTKFVHATERKLTKRKFCCSNRKKTWRARQNAKLLATALGGGAQRIFDGN